MIKSPKQYETTKRRLAEFESALAEFDLNSSPPNITPTAHRAAYDALMSLRDELANQLAEYDRVKREGITAIHFSGLADLLFLRKRIIRR